jgi:hypothetical protein
MRKNLGSADRLIRFLSFVVAAVLFFSNTLVGTAGIVLLAVTTVLLLTSFVSFCPIYSLFGWSTCSVDQHGKTST